MKKFLYLVISLIYINAFADYFIAYCDADSNRVLEEYIISQSENDNITEYQIFAEAYSDIDELVIKHNGEEAIVRPTDYFLDHEHVGFEFKENKNNIFYLLRWDTKTLEIKKPNSSNIISCYFVWC